MRNKKHFVLSAVVTLLPLLAGIFLWGELPDKIATHFNFAGEADGWSSKAFAVFALPLMIFALHLVCVFALRLDPRSANVSDKILGLVFWICPATSVFACGTVYLYAMGTAVNISYFGTLFASLLFVILGNYLPKCRQNYTVGIKLPWTLADEENWDRTHRFAGWLWIAAGLLLVVLQLTGMMRTWSFLAVVLAMVLLPTVYSAVFYLKKKGS
ncbi:MAG: SdpI family protein [Oscillospiraceae bacterium]|nr:SdpI family protein [Oscillospiraceae bacterium]